MSKESKNDGSELVTGCHRFKQPYDCLVRLKEGGKMSPSFGNLKRLSS